MYSITRNRWWRPFQWLELLIEDLGLRPLSRRWRPIRAGEFLLGYGNEDGVLPEGPPAPLGPNGTFMVYRPMQQHVAAFEDSSCEAGRLKLNGDLLRSKIVGRWHDGTPLTLSPERPDPLSADNRRRANDFLYEEERHGYHRDREDTAVRSAPTYAGRTRGTGFRAAGSGACDIASSAAGCPYRSCQGGERALFVCFSSSIAMASNSSSARGVIVATALASAGERDLLLQQGEAQT